MTRQRVREITTYPTMWRAREKFSEGSKKDCASQKLVSKNSDEARTCQISFHASVKLLGLTEDKNTWVTVRCCGGSAYSATSASLSNHLL